MGATKKPETIDDLYGVITRWHIPVFLFALIRGIPTTVNVMAMVFVAPHQSYTCKTPLGWAALEGQCSMKPLNATNGSGIVPCTAWDYDHSVYAGTTIIEEWDLVCDKRWLISTTQSIFLLGVMFGTILFSHIADWFGRKRSCLISLVWASITGILMAFSPSIVWYNIFRFLTAIGTSGYSDSAHVLILEAVAPNMRYIVTLTVGVGWSIGMLFVPLQAYLLPDWNLMHLVTPVPILMLIVLWFFLDESARWLMGAARYSEAREVLVRIARIRGDIPDSRVDEMIELVKKKDAESELKTKPTIADLFSKQYRQSSTIFCLLMMVSYMLWYHVTVSTAGVGGDPYISFATAAFFELPGKILNVVFIRFVRRKRATTLAFSLAAIAVTAYSLAPAGMAWLKLACLITCKMCTGVQGSVQRVQISEIYPSIVRALSTGFFVTFGNFAGAFAPFFDDLAYISYPWVPMAFVAVLCIFSCIAQLGLPETFEVVLTDGMRKQVDKKPVSSQGNQNQASKEGV